MPLKFKKQDFMKLINSHPALHTDICETLNHLSNEDKGKIAGIVIEYVIKSGGQVDIFQKEFDQNDIENDLRYEMGYDPYNDLTTE